MVHDGHVDDRAEHAYGDEESGEHGDSERAVLEEHERHDGVIGAALDEVEDHEHQRAHPEQTEHFRGSPRVVAGDREGDEQRRQAGRERGRADEVDVTPRRVVLRARHREEHLIALRE